MIRARPDLPAGACKPAVPLMDENLIVCRIRKLFGGTGAGLLHGIGDDAAVLRPRGARESWVITTDMMLEDVDFRRRWNTAVELGHKALAINLSDLAAMGARPRFYTAALALPPRITETWVVSFYRGMTRLARQHGAILIGGDLSRSPAGIQVTITAIGTTERKAVLRSGGRPGDILYVTGVLGQAAAGLALLQGGRMAGKSPAERRALRAHRRPVPRCKEGIWLAKSGFVHCMMDLSDGISMDLPRLCQASGVGAEIFGAQLPVFPPASRWRCDPVTLALHGGEDFELLFAVPAGRADRFEAAYPAGFPPVSRIGRLRPGRAVVWNPVSAAAPQPLPPAGFDHFRRRSPDPLQSRARTQAEAFQRTGRRVK